MKVKLIGYTQPTKEVSEDISNVKELVAYCARVSNPSNQMNKETSDRLLAYLIKHKHWSPFEMASATLEIETTRDIARQILRHRSFSFQEFSQRYADPLAEDLGMVFREARLQDDKNRQNSNSTDDDKINEEWFRIQQRVANFVKKEYKNAEKLGIAKEQRRALLPEGLTVSRMYMNGTIRSWIHYIELRAANGTQKEHIEIARACAKAISEIYPIEL